MISETVYLQDSCSWYTVTEKLVELGTDFHYASWRLLLYDEIRHLMAVCFPVGFGYRQ